MKVTSVSEPDLVADREDRAGHKNLDPESCPVCGQAGAHQRLRGPDRFHGRREMYTLRQCPACSLVWLSHPPEPEEMHLHYTDAYLLPGHGLTRPAEQQLQNGKGLTAESYRCPVFRQFLRTRSRLERSETEDQ
jgi:rRNA maturation protein Nop10